MTKSPRPSRAGLFPLAAALALLCGLAAAPATAARAPAGRRVVLGLVPGRTAAGLVEHLDGPLWEALRPDAAVAALNAVVPAPVTPEKARAAVLTGFRAAPPGAAGLGSLLDRGVEIVELSAAGGLPGALAWAAARASRLDPDRDLLLLLSPDPGRPAGGQWSYLAPLLIWGAGWGGGLASSATTRTPGLLANVDVLPTVLAHLGLSAPAGLEGHAARPASGTLDDLKRLVRRARSNRAAMVPGLLAWGLLALAAVAAGVALLLRPQALRRHLGAGRVALAAAASGPAAMLLAAALPPGGPGELLAGLAVLMVLLTALSAAAPRALSPLFKVVSGTCGFLVAALLAGHGLLAQNLMSDFPNIGARFYGIGNEYQGLLLGATLLAPLWEADRRVAAGRREVPGALLAAGAVLVVVAVGSPALGADFGGALAMVIAYVAAAVLLRRARGQNPLPAAALLAVPALLGVTGLLLVTWDLQRPPGVRSHVGELAARVLAAGPAPLVEIAVRKALLNVRMALTPYFLGGVAAVFPLLWLGYHKLSGPVRTALERRPQLRAGAGAVLVGGAACLVLNDTGVISWALATACLLLVLLDVLLEDRIGESACA